MLDHIQLRPFSWSCNFWPQRHGGWGWGWPRGRGSPGRLWRSSWDQDVTCLQRAAIITIIPVVMITASHILADTEHSQSRLSSVRADHRLRGDWCSHTGLLLRMWWLWCVAGSSLMCNTGSSSLMLIKFLRRFYLKFPHIIMCISYLLVPCPPPGAVCGCNIPEIMVCVKIIAVMKSLGIFIWRHFPEPDAAIKVPCE